MYDHLNSLNNDIRWASIYKVKKNLGWKVEKRVSDCLH